ncbi:hypothetical protein SAMN05660199_02772 [Klenkia soli]|uniref:YdhG-like domain-containing protein n=1 Tax=Klenkia soli TaxID=1052260 RepID=A0A1H0N8B2_9ACTN|nr:DUF1801 domain-containing protein [Klenkia soli]SDO88715.1 hypothetical protein SAMN05660199_02772 [Klenkia soli]
MEPAAEIDALVAKHPDWRGQALAEAREAIRAVDPAIEETWKWMGSPVWELDGILVVGDIFKAKVKLGFLHGASLPDPTGLFNGELGGNQRRSYELFEGDAVDVPGLQGLVRAAIERNRAALAERAAKKKR